jgi:two-component system LytT family response regulator
MTADALAGRRRRLLILGFWTVLGLIESSKAYLTAEWRDTPRSWAFVLVANMPWWYVWAALTPAAFWLARRFRLDRPGWGWATGVHFVASLSFALIHLTITGTIFYYTITRGGDFFPDVASQIRHWVDAYVVVDLMTYWAVIGAFHAVEYYRRYREREVAAARAEARAAQLEASMSEAQLNALRMQLNPHFLFNSLNAIAGLVRRRDHTAAIGMLARVGDLLRVTLDECNAHEVPLDRELGFLRHYLDIEQVRFGDRMRVEIDVGPEADGALVPPLILQPLVENTVRHGVAALPSTVHIKVAAHRVNGGLHLEVEDTGLGFRSAPGVNEGVGLSNTRARLRQMYGGAATLAFGKRARGRGACDRDAAVPHGDGGMIRALIVDDEPLARDCIRLALARETDIEIVGECADGDAAVAAISSSQPDIVFLDVQMPGRDGFGVIEKIGPQRMPAVVFVTAFDEFALRAFQVHALDYVLKPFDDDRFADAVRHARQRLGPDALRALQSQLNHLLADRTPAHPAPYATRLTARAKDHLQLVRTEDVDWIEADGNVVRLHVNADIFTMRTTLSGLLAQLDPARFARVHRSTIVNLDRVREIQPWFNWDYVVILHDGRQLKVGRRYRDELLRQTR